MAFQLAWYKTRGEFTATYETALTRMFAHGRTETIRTLTADSRAWVLSMVDREASVCPFPFLDCSVICLSVLIMLYYSKRHAAPYSGALSKHTAP
jgi:Choline/Carnitine o-acyltransferase